MTFRGLVKKELVSRGYQIEIAKEGIKKCHTKGLGYKSIQQEGIELHRTLYKSRSQYGKDEEVLEIYTHGFISKEEMQSIVDKCKEEYSIPYRTTLDVFIFIG